MRKSEYGGSIYGGSCTFYLLTLVEHDITCDVHVVAHKSITTGVLDGALNGRLVLNHVHCKPCSFGERSVLVIDGFHLDTVKGNECGMARPLVAHILHAGLLNTRIPRDKNRVPRYSRWRFFPRLRRPHPCFYQERPRLPARTSSGSVCTNQQHDRVRLRGRSAVGPETEQKFIPGKILDRLASVSLSFASFSDSCRSTLAWRSCW